MGSKGNKSTTTSQQTYTPDPRISAAAGQALSGAQSAAQLPFQMPTAPVAGFSPFQEQAFGQIQGMQGMSLPYFDEASQLMRGSASPISEQDVQQYYNPMAANVTAQLQNIFGQQNRAVRNQLTGAAGGVGASRIAVGQGNLANQQGLAAGQIYSGLYDRALAAAQQQKQMMAGAGYGMGQLGPAAQASYLQGTGALGQAGAQQQALTQAQQNALYQRRLAEIAYPFQTPQYLAGIAGGLAPALGGSTSGQSTTTTPSPSPLNQILGIGGALLGTALGGPMGGMLGGSLGKGAGSAIGSTFGATDMGGGFGYGSYGGTPVPTFFRRGGKVIDLGRHEYSEGGSTYGKLAAQRFEGSPIGNPYDDDGYADGGDVDEAPPLPGTRPLPVDSTTIVPKIPLRMGAGHAGAKLNLSPPKQQQSSGSNALGQVASTAMKFLPMLMAARGGPVNPFDAGQGFQEGGFADDIYPDESGFQPPDTFADRFAPSRGSIEGSELQGMDAPRGNTNPHWSMADIGRRASDFYGDKLSSVANAMEPNPNSPLNVQRYMPSAANILGPSTATAAASPTANPFAGVGADEAQRGTIAPVAGNIPLPRERPDIAGPSRFSPQMPPLSPQQIAQETIFAANKYGVPPELALRLIRRESGFRNIRGAAGEYGPAQLMPGTARDLGISDPSNTYDNIHGGMRYLRQMYDRYGNWGQAVAAYNAGPKNVDRGHIPASTRAYVADVNGDGRVDVNDLSAREQQRGQNPFLANRDMTLEGELQSPYRPYPDATQRDWGQNLARSPWSALIVGGARMAQTAGPVGSAIGAGIEAGMGHLSGQRKALQSEEDMNLKADTLFQHAKQHLDKYQRMTPYESEISRWREAKAESPTALIKNAKWLVDNGIAPDLETAHRMVSSGINQPAVMERAIRAEKANLAKTPEGSSLSDTQLEALARKNVQERFESFTPRAKPKPTQADLDYVKAHPEAADKFRERFGIEPT